MKKSMQKLRHGNEAFLALIWRGRRQWGGLPNYADSAEWWVVPITPGSPCGGAANILWATPSAAGPRSLLIVSGLQILGSVASGSWHFWVANLSFGMIGGFSFACWRYLGRFWSIGEHNKWTLNGLWCPCVSFGMLVASALASQGTLGRSWDDPGTLVVQERTLWSPGLDFIDFWLVYGNHFERLLGTFWSKSWTYHICFQVAFSDDFWVWIWVSGIEKPSIWQGRYCKNRLS